MPMKLSKSVLAILLSAPICAVSVNAATFYWNGAETSTSLGNVGSYSTAPDSVIVPGALPTASDDIVFNTDARNAQNSIVSLAAVNRAYNSLTFASSGTTELVRGSTDSTNSNNLSLATGLTVQSGAGAVTFGTLGGTAQKVSLRTSSSALAIANNSSSALTFNRITRTDAASGTTTFTVNGSGSGNTLFEDGLTNGANATLALVINTSGSGITSLRSDTTASSFTGGFTLTAGNVNANHASALGAGEVNINGGNLDLFGAATGSITLGTGVGLNLAGGTVNFNLGTAFDQIVGDGAAFAITGGELNLDTNGAGFSYASTYQIFSNFTSGSVSDLIFSGYDDINYTASLNQSGLLSFSVIPEPSSFAALAGLATLGLAALRRRPTAR